MTRLSVRLCSACILVVIVAATPSRGGPAPFFNVISLPATDPNRWASITGVSDDGGSVVGSVKGQSIIGIQCAMVWRETIGITLRCLTGGNDSGASISGDGLFIGGTRDDGFNPPYRAPALSGNATLVAVGDGATNGLSQTGDVAVGIRNRPFGGFFRPFLWTAATGTVDLPMLPGSTSGSALDVSADGNVIVGYTAGATVWRGGPAIYLGDLPGGATSSIARAVSNTNDVIVGWGTSASGREATRWTFDETNLLGLGDLSGGSFSSEALDVSSDGQFIVGRGNGVGGDAPFIWDAANGMRNLQTVLTFDLGLDLQGVTLRSATGISADGTVIVGNGVDSQGFQVGWHATIPEPATGVYLFAIATILVRRRRNEDE